MGVRRYDRGATRSMDPLGSAEEDLWWHLEGLLDAPISIRSVLAEAGRPEGLEAMGGLVLDDLLGDELPQYRCKRYARVGGRDVTEASPGRGPTMGIPSRGIGRHSTVKWSMSTPPSAGNEARAWASRRCA